MTTGSDDVLYLDGPTSETGLWLYQHKHEWTWVGTTKSHSLGWWYPVFRCSVCSDVIEDMHAELPFGDNCPEEKCICRAGHDEQHFDGYNRKWD